MLTKLSSILIFFKFGSFFVFFVFFIPFTRILLLFVNNGMCLIWPRAIYLSIINLKLTFQQIASELLKYQMKHSPSHKSPWESIVDLEFFPFLFFKFLLNRHCSFIKNIPLPGVFCGHMEKSVDNLRISLSARKMFIRFWGLRPKAFKLFGKTVYS